MQLFPGDDGDALRKDNPPGGAVNRLGSLQGRSYP